MMREVPWCLIVGDSGDGGGGGGDYVVGITRVEKQNGVGMVCVCVKSIYLYRPDWITTAAGFAKFSERGPGPVPARHSTAKHAVPCCQWGSLISFPHSSEEKETKKREKTKMNQGNDTLLPASAPPYSEACSPPPPSPAPTCPSPRPPGVD